jgi:hypothetical protein
VQHLQPWNHLEKRSGFVWVNHYVKGVRPIAHSSPK